jgi:hypothetical protein
MIVALYESSQAMADDLDLNGSVPPLVAESVTAMVAETEPIRARQRETAVARPTSSLQSVENQFHLVTQAAIAEATSGRSYVAAPPIGIPAPLDSWLVRRRRQLGAN